MKFIAGLTGAVLLAGITAAPALAVTVDESCGVELRQMCGTQTGAALNQCRNANRTNFSAACREALAATSTKLKDVKPAAR